MFKPDYSGGSIANLMGSLTLASGGEPRQPVMRDFDHTAWNDTEHLVQFIIDGLGWDILQSYGADTFLAKHVVRKLTSVFPSTTASALTTLQTGYTPLQHALTGWFVWLKELGTASTILTFTPRWEWRTYIEANVDFHRIYNFDPLYPTLDRDCARVASSGYKGSAYSQITGVDAREYGVNTMDDILQQTRMAVDEAQGRSLTYVYWPVYDSTCHKFGSYSDEAKAQLAEVDKAVEKLAEMLQGKNARIIITADHGFTNVTPETRLDVEDYPDIVECLNIPLCGEPRLPYAYIKPEMTARFEALVEKHLGHCCTLKTRQQVLEENWYGVGEPNPKWADRVGDYILFMHDGWVLTHAVLNETPPPFVGYHGGPSETEMHVPLIDVAP